MNPKWRNANKFMVMESEQVAVKPNFKRFRGYLAPLIISLTWMTLVYQYVVKQFYFTGTYFRDAGWQSYSLCETMGNNPVTLRDAFGPTIFDHHGFYTPALICRTLTGMGLEPPEAFSFLIALSAAGLSLFGYYLCRILDAGGLAASFVAIGLPMTVIGMGTFGYPHVELFAALLAAAGILVCCSPPSRPLSNNRLILGGLLLVAGALGREDIALHVVLGLSAIILIFRRDFKIRIRSTEFQDESKGSKLDAGFVVLVLSSILGAALNLFLRLVFGSPNSKVLSSQMNPISRMKAMVSDRAFLVSELEKWISLNSGIAIFLLSLLLYCWLSKSRHFLVFVVPSIVWIGLNFLSSNPSKSMFGIYNAFPFPIYLAFVPFMKSSTNLDKPLRPNSESQVEPSKILIGRSGANKPAPSMDRAVGVLFAVLTLSTGIVHSVSSPPIGASHVTRALLDLRSRGPNAEAVIDNLQSARSIAESTFGSTVSIEVDSAVLSLMAGETGVSPIGGLEKVPDVILYFETYVLDLSGVYSRLEADPNSLNCPLGTHLRAVFFGNLARDLAVQEFCENVSERAQ